TNRDQNPGPNSRRRDSQSQPPVLYWPAWSSRFLARYLGFSKHGSIAALWQIDDQLVGRAPVGIILRKAGAQFSRLRSHDGILPNVVVRPTSEHLDPDDCFLELIPAA